MVVVTVYVYSSLDYVLQNLLPSMVAKHSGLELAKRGICVSNTIYHLKVLLLDAVRVITQGLVGPSLTLPSCSVSSSLPDADGSPAPRTHLQIKWQI